MRIIVCVKQVPEITDVKVNPETGTLVREGVASILNPFCEYALDLAVELKKNHDDIKIIAMSMGPPQAKAALMKCLELGADKAVLISDLKFAGADTWSTSRTLSGAIKAIAQDFDLILVGKQAIDGDTAQVGPEVAEILGIPQIMYAVGASLSENKKRIRVKREMEDGYEVVEMRLPGVVSASKGEMVRRLPSFKEVLEARKKECKVFTAADLGIDENDLGLKGSPTQVVKVFPPRAKAEGKKIEGLEPDEAAKEILSFLKAGRYIQGDNQGDNQGNK